MEFCFEFQHNNASKHFESFEGELMDSGGLDDSREAEKESELNSVLLNPILNE